MFGTSKAKGVVGLLASLGCLMIGVPLKGWLGECLELRRQKEWKEWNTFWLKIQAKRVYRDEEDRMI